MIAMTSTETTALVESSELDLGALWRNWRAERDRAGHWINSFDDYLRALVTNPDDIDDVAQCTHCERPNWSDDMRFIDDAYVCESCLDWHYVVCDCCEEYVRTNSTVWNMADNRVCESCLSDEYTYCEHCEGYYGNAYADEHMHDEGNGCCESPAMSFLVRNDGNDPLPNDTRVTIQLPAGEISDEGIDTIRRYLRNYDYYSENTDSATREAYWQLSYAITEELGNKWQTKEGNYTKRLSRLAYKNYQLKLPADVISHIGNVASDHSRAVSFGIETSRDLNQSAADWYHEDSCWWQSYYPSRCTLKTNGGYGIRSYDDNGNVSGRAWVLPLRKTDNDALVPTFNTETPDAFAVFNGYGALSGYSPARIVAHMAGFTYRKISFSFGDAYINGGSAYLVAPEDIATKFTDGALHLRAEQHSALYAQEACNATV